MPSTRLSDKTKASARGPIQLSYNAGRVVVTPEDQDRFVLASQLAVAACQSAVANEKIAKMFGDEFLCPLHKWCLEHKTHVSQCYVPWERYGNCIKVFVVIRSKKFDFVLNDAISELEGQFIDAGWLCDILQITSGTPEELQAFFDPDNSLQVYADGHTTPARRKS
ncbi:MAG: hypothetical protein WCJ35_18820 [Planctomycetota bacterium]